MTDDLAPDHGRRDRAREQDPARPTPRNRSISDAGEPPTLSSCLSDSACAPGSGHSWGHDSAARIEPFRTFGSAFEIEPPAAPGCPEWRLRGFMVPHSAAPTYKI